MSLFSAGFRLPAAFDGQGYRQAHPDLAGLSGPGLKLHFLRHGRQEGRLPCILQAKDWEKALWQGNAKAQASLTHLAKADYALSHIASLPPQERAEILWARLALIRLALAQGDIAPLPAEWLSASMAAALERDLGLAAALWPLIEAALLREYLPLAENLLQRAKALQGEKAALLLLGAALAKAQAQEAQRRTRQPAAQRGEDAGAKAWTAALRPAYRRAHLVAPQLRAEACDGGKSAFDRLAAEARGEKAGQAEPLVSLLLPMRDAQATIDTALGSLTAQTWRNLEILLLDNGSSDGSWARGQDWAARDNRIRLIAAGHMPGAYGARNLGLSLAKGALIGLQDADDWSHPERIAAQVQALLAAPQAMASLSHWARFDEALRPACWRADLPLLHRNLSSLLMRRQVVERIGYWDQLRAGADSEYLQRLTHVFGPKAVLPVLPELPLAFGRQRANSLSRASSTGLLGAGGAARHNYLRAAKAWYQQTGTPYLDPNLPRPFPAPELLLWRKGAAP